MTKKKPTPSFASMQVYSALCACISKAPAAEVEEAYVVRAKRAVLRFKRHYDLGDSGS